MFKVALLVAAALRCAGAADIAFDVQLGDDAVVRFQLGDGQDLAETAATWCATHVNSTLTRQCMTAVTEQVELLQSEMALPSTSLEVVISTEGDTATFNHVLGVDVRDEALEFCVGPAGQPRENLNHCVSALVQAVKRKALEPAAADGAADAEAGEAASPWDALLGPVLLQADGRPARTGAALKGASSVGLLFAADWCKPCRAFVPKLITVYQRAIKRRKGFEVVYISASRDAASFEAFRKTMPWLSMPFDAAKAQAVQQKFGVKGFPTLVVLDGATLKVITKDGVQKASADISALSLPWRSPAQSAARLLRFLAKAVRTVFGALGSIFRKKK